MRELEGFSAFVARHAAPLQAGANLVFALADAKTPRSAKAAI